MYVTPERFATMGLGLDLSGLTAVEIQSALYRAGATVNTYCNVPLLPSEHDFRGGSVTSEVHEWKTDPHEVSMTPFRFYPWHQPVRTVTLFRIYSTPTIYTEIDPSEIFINNSSGFIEVSSLKLTQYGVFGAGLVNALVGMWNPQAVVSYTYGRQLPVTSEVLQAYSTTVYRSQYQWWDSATAAVIKVNGSVVTPTIDYDEGKVTFGSAQSASAVITATYITKLPRAIAEAEAVIAIDDLSQSSLRAKGMGGIDSLTVGEISLRRSASHSRGVATALAIPTAAATLLEGFVNVTVR